MAINQAKLEAVPDSSDPTKIQPSDLAPFGAPGSPTDRMIWWQRIAGPPVVYRQNIYDSTISAWRVVLEITFPS